MGEPGRGCWLRGDGPQRFRPDAAALLLPPPPPPPPTKTRRRNAVRPRGKTLGVRDRRSGSRERARLLTVSHNPGQGAAEAASPEQPTARDANLPPARKSPAQGWEAVAASSALPLASRSLGPRDVVIGTPSLTRALDHASQLDNVIWGRGFGSHVWRLETEVSHVGSQRGCLTKPQ